MALIIENGTNVAGANSYVSITDARTYALARGVTLSAVDATVEVFLIKAMDYLESKRNEYQGMKTNTTQALQWPRYGVYIDGIQFSSTAIPALLIAAQVQLAMELNAGIDISPTSCGYDAKREKVDVIEIEYMESSGTISPAMRTFENLLLPLLKTSSGFAMKTLRV